MRWPRPAGGGASHGRPDAPRRRQGKKEGGARGEGDPVASTRRLGTPGVVVVATPGGHPQGRQRPVAGPPWGGRRPHEWGGAPTHARGRGVSHSPPPRAPPRHRPRTPRAVRARRGRAGAARAPQPPVRRGVSTDTRGRKEEGERRCGGGRGRATAPGGSPPPLLPALAVAPRRAGGRARRVGAGGGRNRRGRCVGGRQPRRRSREHGRVSETRRLPPSVLAAVSHSMSHCSPQQAASAQEGGTGLVCRSHGPPIDSGAASPWPSLHQLHECPTPFDQAGTRLAPHAPRRLSPRKAPKSPTHGPPEARGWTRPGATALYTANAQGGLNGCGRHPPPPPPSSVCPQIPPLPSALAHSRGRAGRRGGGNQDWGCGGGWGEAKRPDSKVVSR